MTLENIENIETTDSAQSNVADDFEAALAATATDVVEIVAKEVEAVIEPSDELVASEISEDEDGAELEEENDENAEFRRALRTAPGDWYVVHSYAGY